jgi:predicted DNA-binding antitoxin AbrB/MazE fold protein
MSEVSTYLKVGTTAIVPDMIEDGFFDKDWSLHHAFFVRLPDFPAGPFRATNRDRYNKPRGTAGIRVKNRPGERRIRVSTSESERKDAMGGTIRARVRGGMLEPLKEIDLPEGKEVMVTILEVPSAEDDDAFRRAAGSWKDLVDTDTLIRNIYADRLLSTRPEPRL